MFAGQQLEEAELWGCGLLEVMRWQCRLHAH